MICIIDGRCINLKKNHGISRYTYEIIKNSDDDIKKRLILLTDKTNYDELKTRLGKEIYGIISLNSPFLSPLENIEIPCSLNKIKKSINEQIVYFSPSFSSPPVGKKIKKFITIHDLMHIEFYKGFKNEIYYSTLVKNYLNSAEFIFTVSHFSKEKIIEHYGHSDKIKVVYPGVDTKTFRKLKDDEMQAFSTKYSNIPKRFFLFIGNEKKHKNYIYAYDLFQSLKKFFPHHKLVTNVWSGSEKDDVIKLDKIDDDLLCYLYNCCEAFIYPSLYEGFGLPPLEALACGAKIISSKCASLPEVLGEFAIYIDVFKPAGENAHFVFESLLERSFSFDDIEKHISKYNWEKASHEIFKTIFTS